MSPTPRPDSEITRRRAQEAWAKLRRLQEPPVGARHILAGDGGATVDLAGTSLMLGRVSATGRPIITHNPTQRTLGMGQALEVLPMGETAPSGWRVPPVGVRDVFWVAGAVVGQTPGLFTPAHQATVTSVDVAPDPLVPYQFYMLSDYVRRVTPTGVIDLVAGGGATSIHNTGSSVGALAWDMGVLATSLDPTPSGDLAMVNSTVRNEDEVYQFSTVGPGPAFIVFDHYLYEYDQIDVFAIQPGGSVTNFRVRFQVGYAYYINTDNGLRSDGGVVASTIHMLDAHISAARLNPADSRLYFCTDSENVPIASCAWPPFDTADGARHAFTAGRRPVDMCFDASGTAYIAGIVIAGGGWHVWRLDGSTVAGDGSGSGVFPADGAAATSGDIGQVNGLAFDATGRLLIACEPSGTGDNGRIAAINTTTGTITTLANFGRDYASTENLVEPLATAVFTDLSSLQTDAAGRIYVGGEQTKRIGA